MRVLPPMHHDIHHRRKSNEDGEELRVAQLESLKGQERTGDEVAAVHNPEDGFRNDDGAVTEFQLDDGEDAEADEEHQEHDEVEFRRKHRTTGVAAEVLEDKRPGCRDQNSEERLCPNALGPLADNEEQKGQCKIEDGVVELHGVDGHRVAHVHGIVRHAQERIRGLTVMRAGSMPKILVTYS